MSAAWGIEEIEERRRTYICAALFVRDPALLVVGASDINKTSEDMMANAALLRIDVMIRVKLNKSSLNGERALAAMNVRLI
jgi:hypothetical protein